MNHKFQGLIVLCGTPLLIALCGCSHNDTGTQTATPAQLKQQNDQIKTQANTAALNTALTKEFSIIVKQSGTATLEKASLAFTKDDSGQSHFALELSFTGQATPQKLSGAVQPVTDSGQSVDVVLGDLATGTFLTNQSGSQKKQCVDLTFKLPSQLSVSELLLCESMSGE